MIYGIFHKGSGLGNQLHRYIATRVLALDKGYDYGFINPLGFKGEDVFKDNKGQGLSFGSWVDIKFDIEEPTGKVIPKQFHPTYSLPPLWEEWDKQVYDPDFNFIEDNTIIDGNFEDERYFEHRLPEIKGWLKVKPLTFVDGDDKDNLCVIGFRGGEYYTVPELGLPKEFYERGIQEMKKINPHMQFEVHTDDIPMAESFFPNLKILTGVELAWRSARYAKYSIIANSSFYILPRILSGGITIAPRYWNRYNVKRWDYPQGYYKEFTYI